MPRRKNPFDMFSEFDEMFNEMIRDLDKTEPGEQTGGPFFYGFSMSQRPGEEPEIREFGNLYPEGGKVEIGERRPLVDVFDTDKTVQVVAEMPGIEKQDVELSIDGKELEVKAARGDRSYHELVQLPAEVDIESAKATYKNGVLEITLNKVKKKTSKKKIKVE